MGKRRNIEAGRPEPEEMREMRVRHDRIAAEYPRILGELRLGDDAESQRGHAGAHLRRLPRGGRWHAYALAVIDANAGELSEWWRETHERIESLKGRLWELASELTDPNDTEPERGDAADGRTELEEPHPVPREQPRIPPGDELGIGGFDRDGPAVQQGPGFPRHARLLGGRCQVP